MCPSCGWWVGGLWVVGWPRRELPLLLRKVMLPSPSWPFPLACSRFSVITHVALSCWDPGSHHQIPRKLHGRQK